SRASMLKGGEIGPVIVPGQPDLSVLIKAIRYTDDVLKMPPKGKLSEATIADFVQWVKSGAPWPETSVAKGAETGKGSLALNARKSPWSWELLKTHLHRPPSEKNGATSPTDTFIQAKLLEAKLSPAPPADKRSLIRRVTYDLIGLPPTIEEINDFLG